MKNPFFKGKAFLIEANAWEDNFYVSAFEKYPALAETRNSSTQHWDTKGKSVGPRADTRAEHPIAPSQRLYILPYYYLCFSETLLPCLLPKLSFYLRWNRWTDPSLVFPVCSSHYERALSEQTASWVPIPAPAETWLVLSRGRTTQNKDFSSS